MTCLGSNDETNVIPRRFGLFVVGLSVLEPTRVMSPINQYLGNPEGKQPGGYGNIQFSNRWRQGLSSQCGW